MQPQTKTADAKGRYVDLMQEIKERILSTQAVISGDTGLHGPLAREFCYLQLRMICECIALSCLVAHEEIEAVRAPRMQKEYNPGKIIPEMEKLHPDFYPQPVRFEINEKLQNVSLNPMHEPYLTRKDLLVLYGLCGSKLHRGQVRKYSYNPTNEEMAADIAQVQLWGNKILRLVEQHKLNLPSGHYLLCLMRGNDGPVEVFLAGPDEPEQLDPVGRNNVMYSAA